MEIKVYDESGKVIRIIPMYQAGGVIPQYTPTETTMYRPQASANAMLDMSQRNLEFQNQRAVQQENLALQRNAQLQNSYQFAIQQRTNQAREERYLKQLDLQNRKMELDEMKTAQSEFQNLLDMDNDKFLEGDDIKIQQQMKQDNMDDESFANLDLRDPSVVYDAMNKRRIYLAKYKDAYNNKKMYSDGLKILDNDENDKMIENAAKNGWLDIDTQNQYTTSKLEYRKALEEFRKTGDKSILDNAKQHYDNISKFQTFINEDIYKTQISLDEAKQKAAIATANAEASKLQAEADFAIANKDTLTEIQKKKLESDLQDLQMKTMENDLYKKAYDKFIEENPNPTYEEFMEFKGRLDGTVSKTPTSFEALIVQKVANGEITHEEGLRQLAEAKSSTKTTTTTTYKTDVVSGKQYVDEGTKRIYDGYSTKDTGEFISGFYGPNNIEISMNKNSKEFKDGKIRVDSAGNLIIKKDTLMSLFNVSTSLMKWDETDIKEQIPGAIDLGGGTWQIPPTPQANFGSVSSTPSSSSYSTSTTTTNRYTGTGTSRVAPNAKSTL